MSDNLELLQWKQRALKAELSILELESQLMQVKHNELSVQVAILDEKIKEFEKKSEDDNKAEDE